MHQKKIDSIVKLQPKKFQHLENIDKLITSKNYWPKNFSTHCNRYKKKMHDDKKKTRKIQNIRKL